LLEAAQTRGSVRAGILAEVFRAFHGRWSELGYLGELLSRDVPADLEPAVVESLWHRAERVRAGSPIPVGLPTLVENSEYVASLEACREALLRGDDGAWPLLKEALRRWKPTSGYRLIPLALLLDPQWSSLLTPARMPELLGRYA
jgi:hypothetical protein